MGVYFFRKQKDKPLSLIISYLIYCILADFFINKHFKLGFRLFTVVEYFFLSRFFYVVSKNIFPRKVIQWGSLLFILVCIIDFFESKESTFDSKPTGISALLIISYSLVFLFEQIKVPNQVFIYTSRTFWIATALIIYFSGTFFVFLFSQGSNDSSQFENTYSLINYTFSILRNLFFAIAFLIPPEKENTGFPVK